MKAMLFISAALGMTLAVSACSKDKETGTSGRAKVAFDDANSFLSVSGKVSALANACPGGNTCAALDQLAKFEIKLMSVGIHTNEDTTQGYGSAIYANPACPAPELQTEIDNKLYNYVGFGSCSLSSITTYFDLKSATLNTDLNSQYLPIAPGSYKYGAVTFCQGGAASENYRITFNNDVGLPAGLHGKVANIHVGTCGVTTPEMVPAMVVSEGQSVLVTLSYDLTNTVYYHAMGGGETAGPGCTTVDGGGTNYMVCINPPTISAAFAVQ